jgi:hypothetical protein
MKSRDAIERELAQAIITACQLEQDNGKGFMCPADVLSDLRPPERLTASDARLAVGIADRIWDAELRHHLMVREIVHGARPRSRHAR